LEVTQRGNSWFVLVTKYCAGVPVNNNWMSETFACMVERKVHTEFWLGNFGEMEHFENVGLGKRVILKWVLKNSFGRAWNGLIWLRISEHGGLS